MINGNEIARKYLKSRGIKVTGDATQLLVPFLLMNIAYQIYCKEIKPKPFQHEARKYLTAFSKEYKLFNNELFRNLDCDEAEYVTDEMDKGYDALQNYIMLVRIELMNSLEVYGEKPRDVLTSVLLCDLICQISGIMWNEMYRVLPYRKGETNMHIKCMRKYLILIANSYERDLNVKFKCDLNNGDKLKMNCTILARKAAEWLVNEKNDG